MRAPVKQERARNHAHTLIHLDRNMFHAWSRKGIVKELHRHEPLSGTMLDSIR